MKVCVKCRERLSDEFRFCARDGAPLIQSATHPALEISNGPALDSLEDILASELRELLKRSRVPSASPDLYERVMADYLDMIRQQHEISLQNVREADRERRRWSLCRLGMALFTVTTLSVMSVLLALGYNMPPHLLYVLIGLLGGLISKDAMPRLRGSFFPNQENTPPYWTLPPMEPAKLSV